MHDLQQRIPEDVQINRTHENTQVTKHLKFVGSQSYSIIFAEHLKSITTIPVTFAGKNSPGHNMWLVTRCCIRESVLSSVQSVQGNSRERTNFGTSKCLSLSS